MCVSAEASFALTGILVPAGIYCVKSAGQRNRSSLPVAAIPLLFGIQQFFEGIVWIGIGRGDADLTRSTALFYLFFALAFWLVWIPFSAMFLEPRKKIRSVLGLGALLGMAGGAMLFLPIILNPAALQISVAHHSIHYEYPDPPALRYAPQIVWHLFYVAAISLPLIFSKEKALVGFSTALVVSAVISHVFFLYAFASIWCFFAACLSLYLCHIFHNWSPPNIAMCPSSTLPGASGAKT